MKAKATGQPIASAHRLNQISRAIRSYALGVPLTGLLVSMPLTGQAGPAGENVVSGSAAISRPNASSTHINQSSQKAIINWQQFSIGNNENVQFNQPGASAVALNRVVGGDPSNILGQLSANGRVFLVNPQGVYFGPGAQVDVAGLVASVHDINNDDFLNGNYTFYKPDGAPASAGIVNEGSINAPGGFVVLAGDYVENTGVITANAGDVVLAAGEQFTMDFDQDGLISFAVDEATVSELAGVRNSGQVIANGGKVVMTAKVASDLVSTAVNNEGLVQAHSLVEKDGEVYLLAQGGDIEQSGTVSVAGAESNADGGRVHVRSDEDIEVRAGSEINADGGDQADGGVVRVIAEGDLQFREDASISARAGDDGHRGGFVELSGLENLAIRGEVALGAGGHLLIDPSVLTIDSDLFLPSCSDCVDGVSGDAVIGKGFIEYQLDGDTDVTLVAADEINSSGGPFTIASTGDGSLSIRIGEIDTSGSGESCAVNGFCGNDPSYGGIYPFIDGSDGVINLADVSIDIAGDIELFSGSDGSSNYNGSININNLRSASNIEVFGGTINTRNIDTSQNNGDVFVNGTDVTINGNIVAASDGGNVDIVANDSIDVTGKLVADSIEINIGSDVNLDVETEAAIITIDYMFAAVSAATLDIDNTSFDADEAQVVVTNQGFSGGQIGQMNIAYGSDGSFGNSFDDINAGTASVKSDTGSLTLYPNLDVVGNLELEAAENINFAFYSSTNAGRLIALAGADITGDFGGSFVTADSMVFTAGDSIYNLSLSIGNGNSLANGDPLMLQVLAEQGINIPANPNGVFLAANSNPDGDIYLDTLTLNSTEHLVFQAKTFEFNNVSGITSDLAVQYTAPDPSLSIGLEDADDFIPSCGGGGCGMSLNNQFPDNFTPFSGAGAIVVGNSDQTGSIYVGEEGLVDLSGSSFDMFFMTAGGVDNMFSNSPAFPGASQTTQVINVSGLGNLVMGTGSAFVIDTVFEGSPVVTPVPEGSITPDTPGTVSDTVDDEDDDDTALPGDDDDDANDSNIVEYEDEVGQCA